jgi:hypothetical protein
MNDDPLQNNPLRDAPPAASSPAAPGAQASREDAARTAGEPGTAQAMERVLTELIKDRRAGDRCFAWAGCSWPLP